MTTTLKEIFLSNLEKRLDKAGVQMVLDKNRYNEAYFVSGLTQDSLTPAGRCSISVSEVSLSVTSGRETIAQFFSSNPKMRVEDALDATVKFILDGCKEQRKARHFA